MLLQRYYHAFLGVSVFVTVTLCGELRNIRFGLRRLKERAPDPETTTSYKQRVLELERRQIPVSSFGAFVSTSPDTGPVTDTTTEFATVIVPPSSLAPITVTFISTATTSTLVPITSPTSSISQTTFTSYQPTTTNVNPNSTASATESPLGSGVPLSGIAIGGIVAGCVIGVLVFVLAGWCTCRRLKNRGNHDPPGGVGTTNFFDPTATTSSRAPAGSRYQHGTQEQSYFSKPPVPVVNYPLSHSQASSPPEQMAEMPANSVSYSHSTNWWGAGQTPPDNSAVYEVEGTTPPGGRRSKRWSIPFMKG